MSSTEGSIGHWLYTCHMNPAAVALATRLQLDLPQGEMNGFKAGVMYPVRRLVISGEDTPENMALLFGPTWNNDNRALGVKEIRRDVRRTVLMSPPSQSPAGMVSRHMDEGYYGAWRLRGPSREEDEDLQTIGSFM